MTAQVVIPQKKDRMASLLPVVGGVVGGIIGGRAGGAQGAVGGASAGMGLGGAAAGLMAKDQGQQIQQPQASSAINRRLESMDSDPYQSVLNANKALEFAPQELRDAYKKPLEEAMAAAYRARQQTQNSNGAIA